MSERTKKENRLKRNFGLAVWWAVSLVFAISVVSWLFFQIAPAWLGLEGKDNKNAEILELLTPILGGIVASWVAVLVAMRLEKFSQQVDIQSEQQKDFTQQVKNTKQQLFNESFERGVTFLSHKNPTMRSAGIRVLWDLGKTSPQEQTELIVKIIHDFVCGKAQPKYKEDNVHNPDGDSHGNPKLEPAKNPEERRDIELAIFALASLIKKAKMTAEDICFNLLDLRGLNFQHLDLPNALFFGSYLNGALFFDAKLHGANFSETTMYKAHFNRAKLHKAYFINAKLHGASFSMAELYGADLLGAKLNGVRFFRAKLIGANCTYADFNRAMNLNVNEMLYAIFQSFEYEQEDIKKSKPKNLPGNIVVPNDRAYVEREDNNGKLYKQFVESDAPWSEKLVDEWVEEEIAEAKAKKEAS